MVFSGISFLYYFLPLMAAIYFISPNRLKNVVLLAGSLVFYAWGEPKNVFLMAASILTGYGFGLLEEKYRERRLGQMCCVCSVVISVFILIFFKFSFFSVAFPAGISFYTFQMISYAADVQRGMKAQKNLVSLGTYIAMFPQLIAGPIVRYSDISGQLCDRTHSFELAAEGIRRFVTGLAKKVLLADQLWELCSEFRGSGEKSILFYWLYALASALYIYYDFSGYSDMAIGLGRIFGFHFPENFNYPYISGSVTEFWRRWHISLGSWFRDYVYIPLGGSRAGVRRQAVNILIVWTLTGFWHGAAWNFILWGLCSAVLLILEKRFLLAALKKSRVCSHIYTLVFVLVSFVIFHAGNLNEAYSDILGLFGAGGIPAVSPEALYCFRNFAPVLLLGMAGATPVVRNAAVRLSGHPSYGRILNLFESVFLAALLFAATAYLIGGSFHPFLYFRF